MAKGKINVQTENIFPIIKKFLYSDQEIFLRELVSNAVDATTKLNKLAQMGELKEEIGTPQVSIALDSEANTLTISDQGIGMTEEEVDKYINQIAFSSAEEFAEKFENVDGANIIGHFGLGFYSAFMVADTVDIITKSYKGGDAVKWNCDGSPEFTLEKADKKERGTDIVLHISEDSKEYLEELRIQNLLDKYCKFLPVPIQFGEQETEVEGKEEKVQTPKIINNTSPAWTKNPKDLTDEDYLAFYEEIHPFSEKPLFWIHLNVDFPFKLTGILYFPKLKKTYESQKNKIQLYSNQVFVTDNVADIVPEYLTLLHGVIDSEDIPLNVSRSYLQSDSKVKKITSHISKKVADKLGELYKKDKESFAEKWESTGMFVKYGMLSDEKFYDRATPFCLYESVDNKHHNLEEYKEAIKDNQTDKDKKIVCLYTNDEEAQYSYIEAAKSRGYDVLKFDSVIDPHFIGHVEMKETDFSFKRVDADTVSNLIEKDEKVESVLSTDEEEKLKKSFEETINNTAITVDLKPLSPEDAPVMITKSEFMRRMKDMAAVGGGGGMNFMGDMPEQANLIVNTNHPMASKILKSKGKKQQIVQQLYDLALLQQGMLTGKGLSDFINRSVEVME